MNFINLRLIGKTKEEDLERGENIIKFYTPFLPKIFKNKHRAGIFYLLIHTPQTYHTLTLTKLAYRLGAYPINLSRYHLKMLKKYKLVTVRSYEDWIGPKRKVKARIGWGLDLRYPNWISEAYKFLLSELYGKEELERLTSINRKLW